MDVEIGGEKATSLVFVKKSQSS